METEFKQSCVIHGGAIEKKINQGLENIDGCAKKKKKVRQFYFVKFWPYEEHKVKSNIDLAEKLIENIDKEASPIIEKYYKKFRDESYVIDQLGRLYNSNRFIKLALDWNKELLTILGKKQDTNSYSAGELFNSILHRTNNLSTERKLLREIKESFSTNESQLRDTVDSFSSGEDFRNSIQRLYKILQRSNEDQNRNKRVLKETRVLELVEEKAMADVTLKGKNCNSIGSRKAIEHKIRIINKISEELEKASLEIDTEIKFVKQDLEVVEKDTSHLWRQRDDVARRKYELNLHIANLNRQQDEANDRYTKYVSVMNNARDLARKKNVNALQKLSLQEVHIFMSKWNKNKEFRSCYEKCILPSLENRQLSSDGRIKNLNELTLK